MNRPLWQRVTDPEDPLKWARILSLTAIVFAVLSVVVNLVFNA